MGADKHKLSDRCRQDEFRQACETFGGNTHQKGGSESIECVIFLDSTQHYLGSTVQYKHWDYLITSILKRHKASL